MPRRIYYVTDNAATPMGGALIARLHVRMLRANGLNAALLIRRDVAPDFFETDVPTVSLDGFVGDTTDIYVIPEPWNDMLEKFADAPGRKVVFCQNHHYVYYGMGRGGSYDAYGVATVFCCGDIIAEYLRSILNHTRVPVVHNGIDLSLFRPGPQKRRMIAYMPRKMPVEATFLRETFRRRHPQYRQIPWVSLNGVTQVEVAQVMAEAAVFVALSRIEGVGLPPLEAMASGCLVAGFTGGGGREYANDSNGLWSPADDFQGCSDQIARAMALVEQPNEETRRRWQAGLATARSYDLARMERELLAFWSEEITL